MRTHAKASPRRREDIIDLIFDETIAEGEARGLAKGETEGKAEFLEKVMSRRFGPLPEARRAQLRAATLEQLEAWADEVLDADSVEAVFAETDQDQENDGDSVYDALIAEGEARGLAQGKAQGKAEFLEKMMSRRFGPLSEEHYTQIYAAAPEQLDAWADRMLDADSAEAALADGAGAGAR